MRWQDHVAHTRRENTFRQKAQVSAGALQLTRGDNIKWILKARGCEGAGSESSSGWHPGVDFVKTLKMKAAGYSKTTAINSIHRIDILAFGTKRILKAT
jgi:hypothetical protein